MRPFEATYLICGYPVAERFFDTVASDRSNNQIRETVLQGYKEVEDCRLKRIV